MAQSKNFIDQPYIEVSGSADTLVTPDEIYIRIILSERDTRDRVSIEDLEQKMITVIKGLGLDAEKELTVADMMSNYKFYLLKNKDIIKTKQYLLKVKDAATTSQVFLKLEETGISNVLVERVGHSDMDKLKNIMRANAISNAKASAVALTHSIGQVTGPAIHISDSDADRPLQGMASGIQIRLRGVASEQQENYAPPQIDFQKIKITGNVNAKFVLK